MVRICFINVLLPDLLDPNIKSLSLLFSKSRSICNFVFHSSLMLIVSLCSDDKQQAPIATAAKMKKKRKTRGDDHAIKLPTSSKYTRITSRNPDAQQL